jgi:hypothetical protein
MTTIASLRKQRPAPRRSVRWLRQHGTHTDGWGTLEITVRRRSTIYRCRPITTDFGPGQLGFELHKLDAVSKLLETVYHVLIDRTWGWHRCDCLGHEAHGHCKHNAALDTLCRSA